MAWVSPAGADDLVVKSGESATLSGMHVYGKVTIDGTLFVAKYDGSSPNSGWLHLKSNAISLAAGGRIDATGKGYRSVVAGAEGTLDGAGLVPLPFTVGSLIALPGGGGGHIGKGGNGSDYRYKGPGGKVVCGSLLSPQSTPTSPGGAAYDDATMAFVLTDPQQGMGSAGAPSHAGDPNPTVDLPGGFGGGVIMLEAATITLEGAVLANGLGFDGPANGQGTSPGGGAGGTIYLHASTLVTGADVHLEAAGAQGRPQVLPTPSSGGSAVVGGSGGGGLIVIAAAGAPPLSQVSVIGGASPDAACTDAKGGDGTLYQVGQGSCIDVDGDSHGSDACESSGSGGGSASGDDCNDTEPNIHPGQPELCDGIDQDCSGKADDADDATMCLKNQTCKDGACEAVPPDPETPTDGSHSHLTLGGGLCSWSAGTNPSGWPAFALVFGLLAHRRQRRSPPTAR